MEGIQTTIKYTGPNDSIGVIKVGGYIDTTTSSELERSLASLLKKNQYRIIVDLGDVDYISSAGWGIFISEIKGIKENSGDLKLVRMIPEVYEVFELLEFHYILKAYDTIDDAVDAFVKESGGALLSAPRQTPRDTTTQMVMRGKQPETTSKAVAVEDDAEEEQSEPAEASIDDMSVDEKIEHILDNRPGLSAWQIKKLLNSSEYNHTGIGWFDVRRRLKSIKTK